MRHDVLEACHLAFRDRSKAWPRFHAAGKPRLDRRSPHAEAAAASLLGRLTGAAFRQQVDAAEQGFAADLQQLICGALSDPS